MKPRRADLAGAWKPRGGGWDAGTLESSADAVRAVPNRQSFRGPYGAAPECRASFWAAVADTCGSLRRLEYAQTPHEVCIQFVC